MQKSFKNIPHKEQPKSTTIETVNPKKEPDFSHLSGILRPVKIEELFKEESINYDQFPDSLHDFVLGEFKNLDNRSLKVIFDEIEKNYLDKNSLKQIYEFYKILMENYERNHSTFTVETSIIDPLWKRPFNIKEWSQEYRLMSMALDQFVKNFKDNGWKVYADVTGANWCPDDPRDARHAIYRIGKAVLTVFIK